MSTYGTTSADALRGRFAHQHAHRRLQHDTPLQLTGRHDGLQRGVGRGGGAPPLPVLEVLGTAGRGMAPGVRLLGGLKVPVTEHILVGLAVQVPLTTRRDFDSQLEFGPDFNWSTRRRAGAGMP